MRLNSLIMAVGLMGVLFLSCKTVDPVEGDILVKVSTAKLADGEISGWTAQTVQYTDASGYVLLPSAQAMQLLIDGDFQQYVDRGYVQGAIQEFGNSDAEKKYMIVQVFDQGSSSNATQLFQYMLTTATATINTVPNFSKGVAFWTTSLGGGTFYAHFHNLFFKLIVSGFSVDSDAANAAALFLGTYQSKAK